jgi:hypothetical protein
MACGRGGARRPVRARAGQAGFSLMEAMAATVIAVVAVLGLAYAFSIGRAFINSFEYRRVADAQAQGCMEWLGTLRVNDPNLTLGTHGPRPFVVNGRTLGTLQWRTSAATDTPVNVTTLLRQLTVTVRWRDGAFTDSVGYTRLVDAP